MMFYKYFFAMTLVAVCCCGCVNTEPTVQTKTTNPREVLLKQLASDAEVQQPNAPATIDYQNSLNYYNTYWDGFSGALNIGQVYSYKNIGIRKELHFTILQVLSNKEVLAFRPSKWDTINGKGQDICDDTILYVRTQKCYADGATLREGHYRCTGIFTYETKNGDQKSVYALEELKNYIPSEK